MKLQTKLIGGFGVLLALMTGMAVALREMSVAAEEMQELHHHSYEVHARGRELLRSLQSEELDGDGRERQTRQLFANLEQTQLEDLDVHDGESDRLDLIRTEIERGNHQAAIPLIGEVIQEEESDALRASERTKILQLGSWLLPAIAAVLMGALMLWTFPRILRGISAIDRAASRVIENEEVYVDVEGEDELARLAETFNRMVQEVFESRRRLEEAIVKVKQETERASTSRKMGMADVASAVLHNVGNVLNSLNVSVDLVASSLKKLRIGNLKKVVEMLEGEALTKPKVVPYLGELSSHLEQEILKVQAELDGIHGHVGHIKVIIGKQQQYAKTAGATERCSPAQLARDALSLVEPLPSGKQVVIMQELEDVPDVIVDRHKVLQILINLVANAMHAVAETQRDDRRIIIRVRLADDARGIDYQVIDNGVGILPDNLTRIFAHGFTTKKNGHGLGLHSSALAAKEMHGYLRAESEGPDRGATFTLTLPFKAPKAKAA